MRPEFGYGSLLLGVMLALPTRVIAADESGIVLAAGPGRERVQAACSMCHSLDYIVMNSPFQDKAAWEKMSPSTDAGNAQSLGSVKQPLKCGLIGAGASDQQTQPPAQVSGPGEH
jgi:hypothetical protein